ncbi:hypothetical protein BB559_001974 [Furculomyces boomerangus]|uniref:histidine--tRNA ligase n=2 Tax=Harpellales TaxID=61421 RepID=A0A2T9YZ06_9FUNG|nr:hypothetical protein BB559_001974 [Furculomyces boomerangus]PVZ98214.1 hypothetical protein BB558_005803 [Smittium angustum]
MYLEHTECRSIRGMPDKLDFECRKKEYIVSVGQDLARSYGYKEIQTPILEFASVYTKSVGETSDIASKEMYTFSDRNNDLISLRPEGTAGVVRAFLSNNLAANLPCKMYYSGPMFRHERPQKGRLRQFDQFGIECYGVHHPTADIESIMIAWKFIQNIGVSKNAKILINTLGDLESRNAYIKILIDYLNTKKSQLSKDSLDRLNKNPLRIFDSKDTNDIQIVANSPNLFDYLSPSSLKHYQFVEKVLSDLGIPIERNNRLVRGLDYYDHTVWEIVVDSNNLGKSQDTVLAGGRYNGLVKTMSGNLNVPGIGWGAGIDRLSLLLDGNRVCKDHVPICVVLVPDNIDSDNPNETNLRSISTDIAGLGMRVMSMLVDNKIPAVLIHSTKSNNSEDSYMESYRTLSKQLFTAANFYPKHVVIIGKSEAQFGKVLIRDFETKEQDECLLEELLKNIVIE